MWAAPVAQLGETLVVGRLVQPEAERSRTGTTTGNTAMCADATQSLGLALQQDFERQCARAVAPAAGDPA